MQWRQLRARHQQHRNRRVVQPAAAEELRRPLEVRDKTRGPTSCGGGTAGAERRARAAATLRRRSSSTALGGLPTARTTAVFASHALPFEIQAAYEQRTVQVVGRAGVRQRQAGRHQTDRAPQVHGPPGRREACRQGDRGLRAAHGARGRVPFPRELQHRSAPDLGVGSPGICGARRGVQLRVRGRGRNELELHGPHAQQEPWRHRHQEAGLSGDTGPVRARGVTRWCAAWADWDRALEAPDAGQGQGLKEARPAPGMLGGCCSTASSPAGCSRSGRRTTASCVSQRKSPIATCGRGSRYPPLLGSTSCR